MPLTARGGFSGSSSLKLTNYPAIIGFSRGREATNEKEKEEEKAEAESRPALSIRLMNSLVVKEFFCNVVCLQCCRSPPSIL